MTSRRHDALDLFRRAAACLRHVLNVLHAFFVLRRAANALAAKPSSSRQYLFYLPTLTASLNVTRNAAWFNTLKRYFSALLVVLLA